MLHPNQFQVDDAWIAFRLNGEPIHTEQDGDVNVFAMMDAASRFILALETVPVGECEPGILETGRLLQQARAHKGRFPGTLFIPLEYRTGSLASEAELQGIDVVRVAEIALSLFIGEARAGFRNRFA